MYKFDRVFSTLVLLQTKRRTTAATIADRFGVSMRTVYRDINTLKNAGIPITGDPGIGYSIMEGYHLPPLMFSEEEAGALLTAEKFIGNVTDEATQYLYTSALVKIKAILRSSEKRSLETLDEAIAITEGQDWKSKSYLQIALKGLASRRLLQIQYEKADGTCSERILEPIGCHHHYNNWYLIAYCRLKKDYRTFKLNRIIKLNVLDQLFSDKHISLREYIDRQDKAWKEQHPFFAAEIAFDQDVVQHAERRKFYFGFVEQSPNGDNVHMKFLTPSLEIIARWLLQFGNQATVIEPLALRERIRDLAGQLYRHYH